MARAWNVCRPNRFSHPLLGGQRPCLQPLWEVDLASAYQFHDFGLMKHPRNHLPPMWTNQQGIEFVARGARGLSSSEVNNLEPLRQKEDSGGSGRYVLHVSFLSVTKGNELKTIRLVTEGSGPSRVFPTHDGRYLSGTGETIRSFSAAFDESAAADLPNSKTASNQWSDVSVSPLGRLIYIKYNASYSSQYVRGIAVLDATRSTRRRIWRAPKEQGRNNATSHLSQKILPVIRLWRKLPPKFLLDMAVKI